MTDVSQPRPAAQAAEVGREPGRRVVVLGVALALSAVACDLALSGELTLFFDLSFVTLCLALAVAVKPHDFFTVGVLPPLLMAATFALLGGLRPASVGAVGDGVLQATISGLAHHSAALVAGYLLCLGTLAARRRQLGLALEVVEVIEEEAVDRDESAGPEVAAYVDRVEPAERGDAGYGAAEDDRADSNRLASPAP